MAKSVLGFIIIAVTGISIAIYLNYNHFSDDPESSFNRSETNRLKIFNPADINPTLVDTSIQNVQVDHVISDFEFINQIGDTIRKADVAGNIFVTDFFFTTCGGICPKMTTQLQRVQSEFVADPKFLILSHTVNPSKDSVSVMNNYANRFKADSKKWWFLTGAKADLYTMARKSYLIVPDEADPNYEHGGESDFIHTENFVLIDPDGRIRGIYDGTNGGEVSELIRDVYDLKKEYKFD